MLTVLRLLLASGVQIVFVEVPVQGDLAACARAAPGIVRETLRRDDYKGWTVEEADCLQRHYRLPTTEGEQ